MAQRLSMGKHSVQIIISSTLSNTLSSTLSSTLSNALSNAFGFDLVSPAAEQLCCLSQMVTALSIAAW
jgi:hypothetical protein